jgi:hypothetical protein
MPSISRRRYQFLYLHNSPPPINTENGPSSCFFSFLLFLSVFCAATFGGARLSFARPISYLSLFFSFQMSIHLLIRPRVSFALTTMTRPSHAPINCNAPSIARCPRFRPSSLSAMPQWYGKWHFQLIEAEDGLWTMECLRYMPSLSIFS